MNRAIVFWVGLCLLTFAASLIVSCRNDVVVPFPPNVQGNYKGIYSYRKVDNVQQYDSTYEQLVRWRFTNSEYQMRKDSSIAESLRVFCDVDGDYEVSTGVDMSVTDPNVSRSICIEDWAPDGSFSLDASSDTIRLQRVHSDANGVEITQLLRIVLIK